MPKLDPKPEPAATQLFNQNWGKEAADNYARITALLCVYNQKNPRPSRLKKIATSMEISVLIKWFTERDFIVMQEKNEDGWKVFLGKDVRKEKQTDYQVLADKAAEFADPSPSAAPIIPQFSKVTATVSSAPSESEAALHAKCLEVLERVLRSP